MTVTQRAATPAAVYLDLATAAHEAMGHHDRPPLGEDPPPPYTAMEHALLEEARKCAAAPIGDASLPPRREHIAVALREVRREQCLRDAAEARELTLIAEIRRATATVSALRETRQGLFAIQHELIAALAERIGCEPSAKAVLARIRAERPTLAQAMTDLQRAEVARG